LLPLISTLFPYTTLFRSVLFFFVISGLRLWRGWRWFGLLRRRFFRLLGLALLSSRLSLRLLLRLLLLGLVRLRFCLVALLRILRSEEHTSELQSPYDLVC